MLLVWNLHLDRDEHVKAPFWPACPCCPHLSTFQHVPTWVKSFLSIGNQTWQLDIWNGQMMKIIELDGSSHGCRLSGSSLFLSKEIPSLPPVPPTGRKAGTLLKSPRNGSGNTSWMWRYPGNPPKVPVRFLWDLSCRSGQFLFKNYDPETPRILHFYPFLVMIPIVRLQVLTTTCSPVHFTIHFTSLQASAVVQLSCKAFRCKSLLCRFELRREVTTPGGLLNKTTPGRNWLWG